MKIEHITQQDAVMAHVSGYFCPKGSQPGEAWLCEFVGKIADRAFTQFALVQGVAPLNAIVAQFMQHDAQGTVIYTTVPYGEWMVAVDLDLDVHYKSDMIEYITKSDDLRWPHIEDMYERKTLEVMDNFVDQWNKITGIEQVIKGLLSNYHNAVTALWAAAGVTLEHNPEFRSEMFSYITQVGHTDKDLIPYIMGTEDWRTSTWYPRKQIV